jgi:hypothetical protein
MEPMRAIYALIGASAIALLAGCSRETRLREISATSTLSVNVSRQRLAVFVDPTGTGDFALGAQREKISTNAMATFNGSPLKRMRGAYANGDLAYDRDTLLEFAFPGPDTTSFGSELGGPIPARARSGAGATLRIEDAGGVWVLSVPDAFTPRTLTLVSPADGVLHRGGRVVLRWSPSTDALAGTTIGLRRAAAPLEFEKTDDATIEGDRITVTIPKNLPQGFDGPVELDLMGTTFIEPQVGPCPVKVCKASLDLSAAPVKTTLAPAH